MTTTMMPMVITLAIMMVAVWKTYLLVMTVRMTEFRGMFSRTFDEYSDRANDKDPWNTPPLKIWLSFLVKSFHPDCYIPQMIVAHRTHLIQIVSKSHFQVVEVTWIWRGW